MALNPCELIQNYADIIKPTKFGSKHLSLHISSFDFKHIIKLCNILVI